MSDGPRWRYPGLHASVLACVDTTLWRNSSSSLDWKPYPPESTIIVNDTHARGGFLLMICALLWSNIYDTIDYRLGNELAAQKLVHGLESLPIAREQWNVEAKQIFETPLARIQIDARNIAQGTHPILGYKSRSGPCDLREYFPVHEPRMAECQCYRIKIDCGPCFHLCGICDPT